jgi:lipopolysaccharide transport system permease protein
VDRTDQLEIIIEPGRVGKQYWKELWRYRELLYFLSWRDILVRYKQTVIGISWAAIRPVLTMIIFTIIFGKLAKLPSEGAPYPIMVFAGMLPWQFFSSAVTEASTSVISNVHLLTKVYFPRVFIPTSSVVNSLIDFLISGVIMAGLMAWYNIIPTWRMVILPLFVLIIFAAAMGFSLWLSTLTVRYRDFRYIVPFILQFGLYISPVGFSSSIVPEQWRLFYSINPLVGIIDGFRWAMLGENIKLFWPGLIVSLGLTLLLLISGFLYFRKMERTFADVA